MRWFVECKPDETLVVSLGIPARSVEHAASRDRVCAQLQRLDRVIGMMDEDPHAHPLPYLQSLELCRNNHAVRVLMDRRRNNRVILLCPRLEPWLVRAARQAGLRLTDFGFEHDDGKGLHAEINQRLESLRRLVGELVARKEPGMMTLREALHEKIHPDFPTLHP